MSESLNPVDLIIEAFRVVGEMRPTSPPIIVCSPLAHRVMREFILYPPRMRAYRAIARGADPVAARYAHARIRELRTWVPG